MACESSQQSPHSTNERIRRANIIQIPQPMLLLSLFLSPLSVKFEKFDFFLLTTFTRILISASHSARHSLFPPWMTLLGGGEGYKASLSPASHISEFFSSETFHLISDLPSWQHTIKFLEEVQDDVVDDVKLKRNLHKKKISVELRKKFLKSWQRRSYELIYAWALSGSISTLISSNVHHCSCL